MGAGNAQLVILAWSRHLAGLPFRAAVQMALITHDKDAAPRYWGGWAPIARAAGKSFPDECAAGGHGTGCRGCAGCRPARRSVDRILKALQEAGFCRLVARPKPGRNAEYEIALRVPDDDPQDPLWVGEGPSEGPSEPVDDAGMHHGQTVVHMHHGLRTECTTVCAPNAPRSGPWCLEDPGGPRSTPRRTNSPESPPHQRARRRADQDRGPARPPDEKSRQQRALAAWIRDHPEIA